mgnify:CR=1 FL=1
MYASPLASRPTRRYRQPPLWRWRQLVPPLPHCTTEASGTFPCWARGAGGGAVTQELLFVCSLFSTQFTQNLEVVYCTFAITAFCMRTPPRLCTCIYIYHILCLHGFVHACAFTALSVHVYIPHPMPLGLYVYACSRIICHFTVTCMFRF